MGWNSVCTSKSLYAVQLHESLCLISLEFHLVQIIFLIYLFFLRNITAPQNKIKIMYINGVGVGKIWESLLQAFFSKRIGIGNELV